MLSSVLGLLTEKVFVIHDCSLVSVLNSQLKKCAHLREERQIVAFDLELYSQLLLRCLAIATETLVFIEFLTDKNDKALLWRALLLSFKAG